ncbi:hypothetical protein GGU45_001134 [Niabella hirudinis]
MMNYKTIKLRIIKQYANLTVLSAWWFKKNKI